MCMCMCVCVCVCVGVYMHHNHTEYTLSNRVTQCLGEDNAVAHPYMFVMLINSLGNKNIIKKLAGI